MKYITFNPKYSLKPDDGKALIMASLVGRNLLTDVSDSFCQVVHPIHAMILSFINGREYNKCVTDAAETLALSDDLIKNFVDSIIDNPNYVYIQSKDGVSALPPYTVISISEAQPHKRYSPEMFEYAKLDLRMKRHMTPSTLTLMFNNICVTDCIYCYQDKTRRAHCSMPLSRIMEIIHEAHELHVNTIDVIGGEFFLYKHWREVLAELRKYGYNPYLSTKMPLKEDDIKFLSDLKVRDIQISLDTAIEEHLISSIGVTEGYLKEMLTSMGLIDKYGIQIMVHTVLTQYNDSVEDMKSVYEAIIPLKNLMDWHIVKGDASLYPKAPYEHIEISHDKFIEVCRHLNNLNKLSSISITFPQTGGIENENASKPESEANDVANPIEQFFNRSFCSGLFSSLYVLPNGKVTMCEQLYWNPRFIIGDVMTQSIQEIWNSDKAKSIYYIKQEDIPADSLCHSCARFDECRKDRQVCYREIVRTFGNSKWYYPDPSCPYLKKQA